MDPSTIASVDDVVVVIDLGHISPHPFNPKHRVDPDRPDLEELAESIRQEAELRGESRGVIEAITVHPTPPELAYLGTRYVIGRGHRRYAASRLADQPGIRAHVEEASAEDILARQIIENAQREPMPPCAEARQIKNFMTVTGQTQAQAARRFGKSQSWAAKRLPLLELPRKYQDEVDADTLSAAAAWHLRRLAKWPDALKRVREDTAGQDAETTIRDAVDEALASLNGGDQRDGRGRKRSLEQTARQILRRATNPPIPTPLRQRGEIRPKVAIPAGVYADGVKHLGKGLAAFLAETATRELTAEIERRKAVKEGRND